MAEQSQQARPPMMRRGGGPAGRMAGPKEKPKNTKKSLRRLFSYVKSQKLLFIGLTIIVIIYTITNVSTNLVMKDVISYLGEFDSDTLKFTIAPNREKFIDSIILLLILYVSYCILQYLSSLLSAYLSAKTVKKMRNDLFSKIVKLPISYIDRHPHGDIMSRMTNDVDNISVAISSSITSLLSGLLTIIGCLAIMIYYSPLLTLVASITLIFTIVMTKLMSKFVRPLLIKQQGLLGALNTSTEEMVTGYLTVMAYNRKDIAINKFNKESDQFTKVGMKAQIIGGSMGPLMNFISNLGYFAVCIFGSLFILKGVGNTITGEALTVAIVIMFLTTNKQFTRPINEIAQLYSSILTALAGAERIFAVLDEESENLTENENIESNNIKGNIDFEHVVFGYNENKIVLKDFSLNVRSGHKIALVGATGSGKTTIVNLLLRFYDINSGVIKVDGKDITKISKYSLRNTISIVLQNPVLFNDTIEANVRYGRIDATDEEVDEALKLANCDKFVNLLPQGKKTILTEGATNISQGQRQLITIARAVLADPKILILDEATSSVDTRTEKHIQEAMINLMKNRTSIIIAHRLSTIKDSDLIVVLDNGIVQEMGNHKELIEKKGVYNKLYQTQFKGMDI